MERIAGVLCISTFAGALILYLYLIRRKDNFVSNSYEYSSSCSQVCSIAHPESFASCRQQESRQQESRQQDENHLKCDVYKKCVNECRADQKELSEEERLSGNHEWGGQYGKLL